MHSRQVKKYILCFFGGSSIGKVSKKFGIPKITLSDKVKNRSPNKKPGSWLSWLKKEKKVLNSTYNIWSLWTTHYPCPLWKHLLGVLLKKASDLTVLMQKQDLEISAIITLRKGTMLLVENQTILTMVDPGWLMLLCMSNNLTCWKKSSMICSWQRSLQIFLIAMSPWLLWTGTLEKSL